MIKEEIETEYNMAAAPVRRRPRVAVHKKDHENAWSVANFESERLHLTLFVREEIVPALDDEECRRILVRAPVKSGKREIVEYTAQRDSSVHSRRCHAFLSAWHRAADENQRKELELHNMSAFSIINAQKAEECNQWIQAKLAAGMRVVLHIDECDFGAGARQHLGKVYIRFRVNDFITIILYSATPEEVLLSGEVDEKEDEAYDEMVDEIQQTGKFIEYTPPEGYCGPARFLEEDLVFEASPFFEKEAGSSHINLSEQGSQIITDFREHLAENPRRNIIVLRLSCGDGGGKENKHIYNFLRGASTCHELDGIDIIAAKEPQSIDGPLGRVQTETIQWSNEIYWARQAPGRPMIFVIDQTASRSTEFKCHDRIFAYHDYRNKVVYTTISQAQERVNHYSQNYGGFQPIRIYGHVKTFQLSAGQITYDEYMNHTWTKKKVSDLYFIKKREDDSTHPNYPHYMSSVEANRVLHQLEDDAWTKKRVPDLYLVKSKENDSVHPDYPHHMSLVAVNRVLHLLGCFVQIKVSERVRGRVKTVPVYECKFESCTAQTFSAEALRRKYELRHDFQNPFARSAEKELIDGRIQGYLREWNVFEFSYIESNKGWGMTNGAPRLTICYREGVLGVAVRWKSARTEVINTLATYKSMYRR